MSRCLVNIYICPSCKKSHQTLCTYSMVMCQECITIFKVLNKKNEELKFKYNFFFETIYSYTNYYESINLDCYVNGLPSYAILQFNSIFIIATKEIPKKKVI